MASLVRAKSARMLTPINSLGATPIIAARERFTRKTLSAFIVHYDEIGDGVEDFQPVPVGLVDAREQAGVFQRHGGVTGNGLQ